MAAPEEPQNSPPGMWKQFQKDLAVLPRFVRARINEFFGWVFAATESGARRRLLFFLIILPILALWGISSCGIISSLAVGLTRSLVESISPKPTPAPLPTPTPFLAPVPSPAPVSLPLPDQYTLLPQIASWFADMFAADNWRHLLAIILGIWFAYRFSATYLDWLHDLKLVGTATRFLLQVAFSLRRTRLAIENADVFEKERNHPILRIGGPGLVTVSRNYVALFELPDGTPHVVGPTDGNPVHLVGFERLRQVLPLQDQVLTLTVSGRTQDGLEVHARDARFLVSVARGDQPPSDAQPSPFDPQAVESLVYNTGSGTFLQKVTSRVEMELKQFIFRRTLSEFLTNSSAGLTGSAQQYQVTNLFLQFGREFNQRRQEHGLQIKWEGAGAWVLPMEINPHDHLDAWHLSAENLVRRSPAELEAVRQAARAQELERLIGLITGADLSRAGPTPELQLIALARLYRDQLRQAEAVYNQRGETPPARLGAVIQHTNLLIGDW